MVYNSKILCNFNGEIFKYSEIRAIILERLEKKLNYGTPHNSVLDHVKSKN